MLEQILSNFDITQALAYWGAVLSTALAGVKVWEIWDKRLKINISATWSESEEDGNIIKIRNLSSFSVILTGWEMLYCQQNIPTSQEEMIEESGFDWNDITIKPASTFQLEFKDEYHFSTYKTSKGKDIYIKLHLAGYRTITRKIKKT